ncbi:MAG: nitrite reductase (NAD(P)H) small subunit [Bacteroidota bacterium]
MDGFEQIAKLSDFRLTKAIETKSQGMKLALFLVDSRVFATENNCPHQHFELLHQGLIEGTTITCPMHGRTFNLETGQRQNGAGKLRLFEVKVAGEEVWIKKPEETPRLALFDK